MQKRKVNQILEDFQKDFYLSDRQMKKIVKPEFSSKKIAEIAGKLEKIRTGIDKIARPTLFHYLFLFTPPSHTDNYFHLLERGRFDQVLEDLEELRKFVKKEMDKR